MELNIAQVLEAARATITATTYCFLITLDEQGQPDARLVEHAALDDDMTVWFGTSPFSRKIKQLEQDHRLTVTFQYDAEFAYVVMTGKAEILRDLATRRKYWQADWEPFFPGGADGDDFVVIRFVPNRIEVLNFTRKITPPPFGMAHVNLLRAGDGWVME